MNKVGLISYWLVCLYVISQLALMNEWLIFVDLLSLTTVLAPTIAAWFIRNNSPASDRVTLCVKVCWLSGGLMFVYGLISLLSNFHNDAIAMAAGLSVALIPIIYAIMISLLLAPFTFHSCHSVAGKQVD